MEAAVLEQENQEVRQRLAVVFLLVALDLMIKTAFRFEWFGADFSLILIEGHIELGEAYFNYGNMWSPSQEPETASILIPIFNWVIIGVLSYFMIGSGDDSPTFFIPLLSGALGNEVDRLLFGGVCDWFAVSLTGINFGVFNLADVLIWSGQAILVLACIKDKEWGLGLFFILVCFARPIWMMV